MDVTEIINKLAETKKSDNMRHYLYEAKIEEISIQRNEIGKYIDNGKEEPEYDIDLALYIALTAAKNGFLPYLYNLKPDWIKFSKTKTYRLPFSNGSLMLEIGFSNGFYIIEVYDVNNIYCRVYKSYKMNVEDFSTFQFVADVFYEIIHYNLRYKTASKPFLCKFSEFNYFIDKRPDNIVLFASSDDDRMKLSVSLKSAIECFFTRKYLDCAPLKILYKDITGNSGFCTDNFRYTMFGNKEYMISSLEYLLLTIFRSIYNAIKKL